MADFHKFLDKLSFRERSEKAETMIELSLQPCSHGWHFRPMELLCLAIFLLCCPLSELSSIIKGKGPMISSSVRTLKNVKNLKTMVSGIGIEFNDQGQEPRDLFFFLHA
jgi:uroporphyrinogen decarboxylase